MFLALLCVHAFLFCMTSEVRANKYLEADKDASGKFADLLKDLVAINERRFETMKELVRLQEYSVNKNLRTGREFLDGQKKRSPLVIIILEDNGRNFRASLLNRKPRINNLQQHRTNTYSSSRKSFSSSESDEENVFKKGDSDTDGDDSDSEEGLDISRKSRRSSCGSKVTQCRKACYSAYKNACSSYGCSRGFKRNLRTECKRSCRSKFSSSEWSDNEYSYYYDGYYYG